MSPCMLRQPPSAVNVRRLVSGYRGCYDSGPAFEGMSAQALPAVSPGRARYALGVLFTINLFNYVDRQVISGVLPLVQRDLGFSDTALGWLASAFMILYLAGSIPLGVLGDRMARNRLIAVGVGVWGAATVLSGLARTPTGSCSPRGPSWASARPPTVPPRARWSRTSSRASGGGSSTPLFNAAIPLGGADRRDGRRSHRVPLRMAGRVPPGRSAERRPHDPGLAPRRPAKGRAGPPDGRRARAAPRRVLRGRGGALPHADLRDGLRGRHARGVLDRRLQPLAPALSSPGQAAHRARGQLLVRGPVGVRRTPRRRQRGGSSGTCWRAGPPPGTSSRSPAASCSRPRPAS